MRDEGAAPKASVPKRIVTYGATLIVAAVVIYGLSEYLTPIQKPKQGDCAYLTGSSDEGRYNAVDCSAPNANYVVAGTVARSAACPNPADADWVPVRAIDPKIRFCLVPIYAEGECYDAGSGFDLAVVDCGSEGSFRVARVSKEVPAPACPAGADTRAFPEVKLTYCVASQ
ncbi:LppU/SCO3897 family protein [Lentzea sp. NPDC054927]